LIWRISKKRKYGRKNIQTSINNQAEAIYLSVNQTKTDFNLLKKQLKFVENQLAEIDKELVQLIVN